MEVAISNKEPTITDPEIEDALPDVVKTQTWNQLVNGEEKTPAPGSKLPASTVTSIVKVAEDYKSPNFTSGASGWRLGSNGVVEAVGAIITGDMTATTGHIGGWTINPTTIAKNNIVLDSANDKITVGVSNVVLDSNGITARAGTIGGTTITTDSLYGGKIKTSANVEAGDSGVIMDSAGLRGYDTVLGETFNLPVDGTPPSFSSGTINATEFTVDTNAVIKTSDTVGDGTANSAGILINDTGLYGCAANQTPSTANVKVLINGEAVINANVKGGQTDFNTGTGYFIGLAGGLYKLSLGSPTGNYLLWDGSYLTIKGSFDVGSAGVINNAVYTVANLPIPPTTAGFNVPSAYE